MVAGVWGDGRGAHHLLPPCGRCRELISDFDPATRVIVGTLARPYAVTVAELLPLKEW